MRTPCSPPLLVSALLLAVLCVLVVRPGSTVHADEDRAARTWQERAQQARWRFEDAEANPLFCALKRNGKFGAYQVNLRVQKGARTIMIDVLDEGVVKHSWHGHRRSVFVIRDKRLFYADFSRSRMGAAIVAVDLETGQRLWRRPCRGLPKRPHSGYRNHVLLGASKDVLVIKGRESYGRYIEYKRPDDGTTVGHRIFEDE